MLNDFETILLDMNATFMFGHDRFDNPEDFGAYFCGIGGSLSAEEATDTLKRVIDFLALRYPDPKFRECFPSVGAALDAVVPARRVNKRDLDLLIETFAYFERGVVPPEFAAVILKLRRTHKLGLVADIWAPKESWLVEFRRAGIASAFQAMSFSSDHGMVKPSPEPFRHIVQELCADPGRTVVIGDSVRRDLGGARAAGLPCILVGGAQDQSALHSFESLLCLQN